jgi:ABC-type sugar transport system substrate-binding protein
LANAAANLWNTRGRISGRSPPGGGRFLSGLSELSRCFAALTQTQNLLQAHPDATAVLLQFGGQLPGVVQAGKTGQVKIYDIGGTQEDKPAIESGELDMTVPFFPYTQAYCAVEMLAAMNAGMAVPRVVVNDCHKTEGSPDQQNPAVITKDNIGKFVPQG